jgi:hypothetical protein
MRWEDHRSGKKKYIKWQIIMLIFFLQNCTPIHNPLFLWHIIFSVGYLENYNNYS